MKLERVSYINLTIEQTLLQHSAADRQHHTKTSIVVGQIYPDYFAIPAAAAPALPAARGCATTPPPERRTPPGSPNPYAPAPSSRPLSTLFSAENPLHRAAFGSVR